MSNIQESFGIQISNTLDLLIFKTKNSQLSNSLYVLGAVNVVGHFNNRKYLKFKGKGSILFWCVTRPIDNRLLSLKSKVSKFIECVFDLNLKKWICYHWYMWGITDMPNANFSSIYNPESDVLDESCGEVSAGRVVKSLMTFLILYNNVVPISLLVTIEVVKYVQAILIGEDDQMMHHGVKAKARTSNLNEELGQISYIFTDKTGTLTENIMEFKKCSIGGALYSNDEDSPAFIRDGTRLSHDECYKINMDLLNKQLGSRDDPNENDRVAIFLRMMAVCQTVVPERTDNGEIEYQERKRYHPKVIQ